MKYFDKIFLYRFIAGRIYRKMSFVFISIFLLFFVIYIYSSLNISRYLLKQEIISNKVTLSSDIDKLMSAVLEEHFGRIQFLIHDDMVVDSTEKIIKLPAEQQEFKLFLQEELRHKISDLLHYSYGKNTTELMLGNVFISDLSGNIIVATNPSVGKKISNQSWFNDSKVGFYLSGIQRGVDTVTDIIIFGAPIFNSKDELVAVLNMEINVELIKSAIKINVDDQEDSRFFILDSSGKINLSLQEFENNQTRVRDYSSDIPSLNLGYGQHSVISYDSDTGDRITVVVRKLGSVFTVNNTISKFLIQNLGWYLAVETNDRDIFLPVAINQTRLVSVGILVSFGIFILVFVLAKMIAGPILLLQAAMKNAAEGKMDTRLNIKTIDELGVISGNFNQLVSTIDKKVTMQTSELLENEKMLESQKQAVINILEDVEVERDNAALEKDKMSAILYSIGDGVFVVDESYNIVMINDMASKLSGVKANNALGKKYSDVFKFVAENDVKKEDKFVQDVLKTGERKKMAVNTVLLGRGGKKIPVADSASPLKNMAGKTTGCVVVFRDVEKEREIDKAKTEFVSLASHQLRTPLSIINWYSEMLMSGDAGKINKEQKKYLDEIYKGNHRMIDLVNSLLNVSRLELGTFVVESESVDVVEVSKAIVAEMVGLAKLKNIKIVEEYKKIPKIQLDPKLLAMVLQNLLSNSVKYTPKGGEILVSIAKSKKIAKITVSDNGYGIPKEQQVHIFEKLFRADNIREKDTEGTGLGLYIVKSIIEQFGGSVHFESSLNKGTTIFIELPLDSIESKNGIKSLGE